MENPTFRLEGIVKSHEAMEDFEGPLALILQLLSRNKIEIRDIRISEILEQYLAYLDKMKQMDLEIASEFVAMASHLTYIKAKTLLAVDESEPVSELDALISSLEALKNREHFARLRPGVDFLTNRVGDGLYVFTRQPEPLEKESGYRYVHSSDELLEALRAVLGREREREETGSRIPIPGRLAYPIGEKAEEILLALRKRGRIPVQAIFSACSSRSELVAAFMAVLDLARSGGLLLLEDATGAYTAQYTPPQDAVNAEGTGYDD